MGVEGCDKGKAGDRVLTDPPFYLPEFEKSYRYIIDEYDVAPKEIAIFMPCAVRKPYSASPSHQLIRSVISQVLDRISTISSSSAPAGLSRPSLKRGTPMPTTTTCSGNARIKKSLMIFSP